MRHSTEITDDGRHVVTLHAPEIDTSNGLYVAAYDFAILEFAWPKYAADVAATILQQMMARL